MGKINKKRLKDFGLIIDEDKDIALVSSSKKINDVTRRELNYHYKTNFELSKSQIPEDKFTQENIEDTREIITEIEKYVSDAEFEKSAEIALNATSETDAPAVKLFDNLLAVAISRGASDLHIDPTSRFLNIRMRFDGQLIDYASLDVRIAPVLLSRMKLVSGMDITEKRKPQDGRFSVSHRGRKVDIRVASIAAKNGERLALRLFNHQSEEFFLQEIGLQIPHIDALTKAISRQNGLVLICGPTGSGKTTTIYTLLSELRGRGLNIMTIEDPVEVGLDGIVQTQVDEAVGLDFSAGLRSILRNDPDVVLVGEIRDEKTAEIAVRAAMTGHLVISTVHANSPKGAIKRLINLGIDASLISESLIGVFSQRLVRLYCPICKNNSINDLAHTSILPNQFKGCEACFHTGFKSRVPVMTHILMSSEDKNIIENDISLLSDNNTMISEAEQLHKAGNTPLFEVSKLKVE